jgi:hypothetical protein
MKHEQRYNLKDALMGGPGLTGYAYQAATYCIECGRDMINELAKANPKGWGEPEFQDSEILPQPMFFEGDGDCCDRCESCL